MAISQMRTSFFQWELSEPGLGKNTTLFHGWMGCGAFELISEQLRKITLGPLNQTASGFCHGKNPAMLKWKDGSEIEWPSHVESVDFF